jgi:Ran GTPase-activating protein (RanGAP) involved in mRNA processing and transport
MDIYETCSRLRRNEGSLTILNLNFKGVTNSDAIRLASALETNTKLVILFLDGNEITAKGACALFQSIATHPTLKQLFLSYNDIGDTGAKALAQALESSKLQVLKIAHNNIGASGCEALGNALRCNSHLKTLVLGQNDIDTLGTQALASGLEENTTLTSLHIRDSQVRNTQAFSHALALHNKTLCTLDLDECDAQVDFFLELNKMGRNGFGKPNIPPEAWTRVLDAAGRDPQIFYHVLRTRPDLL